MKLISLIFIISISIIGTACNQVEINADAFKKSRLVGSASNNPPVLDPLSDEAVSEANPVTTIDLNDLGDDFDQDNNPITYSCVFETVINGTYDTPVANCSSLPGSVSFNSSTGIFDWTPDYTAGGIYEVWFSASDGNQIDRKSVTYTITNVNRPPVLDAIPASISSDVSVAITTINVNDGGNDTDIDGTALTYSCLFDTNIDGALTLPGTDCTSLGGTVSFNTTTGVFNWTPSPGASGTYELFFKGSDGFLSDTKHIGITVADLSLGNFNILGVTGGSDVTQDNKLDYTTYPVINWAASTGAASYDVKIFENDGITAVGCGSTTGVNGTSYNFATCSLAPGTNYKVRVIARSAGGGGKNSANDMFNFKLNSLPLAVNDGAYYVMASGSITVNVLGDNLATGAYDPDSDPDGDTISHVSKTNGTKGNTAYSGSNIVYTASPGLSGKDTFTYTITDGKGGNATGTVSIYIISGFTWFGGVDSNWNTPGNWCGTINATKTSCTSGSTLPGITDTVNFNGACTNCNVNINTNVDVSQFNIDYDFPGTITQNTFTVKARTSYIQNGGTFTGGSGNIDVTDTFQVLNGTFTSTSGVLKVFRDQGCCGVASNNFIIENTATFNHNNGTVNFSTSTANGSAQQVVGLDAYAPNVTFYNLTLDGFDADVAAGGSDDTIISIRSGTTITVQNTYTQLDGRAANGTINILGNTVFQCASADICSDGGEYGYGMNSAYPSTILAFKGAMPLIQTIEVHGAAAVPSIYISGTGTVNVVSDTNDLTITGNYKQTSGVFNAPSGWMNLMTHSQNCCGAGNSEGFRILGGTFNSNSVSLAFYGQNINSSGGTPTIGVVQVPLGFTVKDFIYAHETPWSFSHWDFAGSTINVSGNFRFVDGYMEGTPAFNVAGNISFECAGGNVCAENSPGTINISGTGTQTFSQASGAGILSGTWIVDKPGSVLSLATDLLLINGDQDLLLLDDSQIDMNGFNLTITDSSFFTHNTLYMFPNTLINRGVTPGTLTYEMISKDPTATINPP